MLTAGAKYLGLQAGDLFLIAHLSRAGWLRWSGQSEPRSAEARQGAVALRVHLSEGGFDLTEAGTQKRLAVWLVDDPGQVPGIAALGPDALAVTVEQLGQLLAPNSGRIKTVLTDQKVIAGIGNAYSDEILHVARLSPFATAAKLTPAQLDSLHDAMVSVLAMRCTDRSVSRPRR